MGKNKNRRRRQSQEQDVIPSPNTPPCSLKEQAVKAIPSVKRQKCGCEATKHELINNCLKCGRIVCKMEGSGSCFTCAAMVCTDEERRILDSSSLESESLQRRFRGEKLSFKSVTDILCKGLNEAVERKNKLLDFDRTVERRTHVYDDEGDHYNSDSKWLSNKQREVIRQYEEKEPKHSSLLLTLDFAGRRVVEEPGTLVRFDVTDLLKDDISIHQHFKFDACDTISQYEPKYMEGLPSCASFDSNADKSKGFRIQDKELQQMFDGGMCLSIHQPYASLLIVGVKRHEGRNWCTGFRGRLWIHAAAKKPLKGDIVETEKFYSEITNGAAQFPKDYPTGCLLGYVELVDCLSQEEYRKKFPAGECASSFVFICENPQGMKIKIPMKGKHKIFELESKVHKAAKITLQRIR